jgi:hypothetical protein
MGMEMLEIDEEFRKAIIEEDLLLLDQVMGVLRFKYHQNIVDMTNRAKKVAGVSFVHFINLVDQVQHVLCV